MIQDVQASVHFHALIATIATLRLTPWRWMRWMQWQLGDLNPVNHAAVSLGRPCALCISTPLHLRLSAALVLQKQLDVASFPKLFHAAFLQQFLSISQLSYLERMSFLKYAIASVAAVHGIHPLFHLALVQRAASISLAARLHNMLHTKCW